MPLADADPTQRRAGWGEISANALSASAPAAAGWVALAVCLVLLTALVAQRIFVAEDAYITFRTIDNLLAGNGLRWNLDERVQTFTHPLWLLVQVPLYAATRSIEVTVTVTALAASVATFVLLGVHHRRRPITLLVTILLPLSFSSSFLLYSTSGLENSLSHLCAVAFSLVYLRTGRIGETGGTGESCEPTDNGEIRWLYLFLVAGLAVTNRLDSMLIYAPPLALLAIRERHRIPWTRCAVGLSPAIAWLLFSIAYYGFAFPNTAPAKLSPDIPLVQYLFHGSLYVLDLVRNDPVAFATIVLGMAVTVDAGRSFTRRSRDAASAGAAMLGLGMSLYCLYVVRIGGGFLSGRFWTLPVLLSCVLLANWVERRATQPRSISLVASVGATAGCVAIVALLLARGADWEPARIEHEIYSKPLAYKRPGADLGWEPTAIARQHISKGEKARIRSEGHAGDRRVSVLRTIGMSAIAAGSDVIVIDPYALADPLLARLPPKNATLSKVGHVKRDIPEGYVYARRTGSLERMHPALRAYYEPLRRIVSDPVFGRERLRTLAAFHLGAYEEHRAAYLRDMPFEPEATAD